MRIVLIVPSGVGGTLQYSHNQAEALVEQGHDVVMATAIGFELSPFARSYEAVEVFDRFTPHFKAISRFVARMRSFDPEIIHFQGAQRPEFYVLVFLLLRSLTRARFVWTPQDILSNSEKPYHLRLLRYLYRKMGHVFLNAEQNRAVMKDLFDVPEEKTSVFPIPDLVAFARTGLPAQRPPEFDLPEAAPLVLCFGLIEERKGIGTLLQSFAQVAQQHETARLLIMGKPLIPVTDYRRFMAAHKLDDRAQIVDRYASFEEMNWLFQRAHFLVMPYHSGWNSGVLASAYGFGKPVITSRVGGFEEVVHERKSGLLVAPKEVEPLTEAMLELLGDTALYEKLCKGAQEEDKKASWPVIASGMVEMYRRLGTT